jgi:diguanylate cyclase (GGDEF)-like protein
MNSAQQEFEKKLHEARIKYVNTLPAKVSEINLIWNQLNKNAWRSEVLLKMQNLAHNLAGSGGTFGFPELSQQAKRLEKSLDALKNSDNTTPDDKQKTQVNDILVLLQEIELATIHDTPELPSFLAKSDVVYILDSDKEFTFSMSRQLMYYGCSVKILNDTSTLDRTLRNATPLLILIDADFAELTFGNRTVIQTLRKDWLLTCPIIYISRRDDFESRMRAIKSTSNAYFTKPLDMSLAIERIHVLTNAGIVEPYRILVVEDDVELANFYAAVLERGGMKVAIETKPELALSRILEINPELVVMDLYMPNYNGIDLIKTIRQHLSFFTLPIVLLTAEKDVNLQFLARDVGVDDFLIKPITETHLYDSVLNRVQRARYTNVSMAKDSLTGLFVHKKINEFLDVQLNICRRYNRNLSYIILDIDNFKQINDTYGHLAGDNVLVTLANLLKTSVRVNDFVGRYGGEEFVIISPETDENSALVTVERLRKMFAVLEHYSEDKTFNVTFSAGIASFPKYGDLDVIMATADKALYQSKENGRNQITIG